MVGCALPLRAAGAHRHINDFEDSMKLILDFAQENELESALLTLGIHLVIPLVGRRSPFLALLPLAAFDRQDQPRG